MLVYSFFIDIYFEKLYYQTKHKLGSEKLQVCKLLIFGPPGAGKSSLLKVLLGENPNLLQSSTGVCDRKLVQCNIAVTTPKDGPTKSTWTKINLEHEVKQLRSKLKRKVTSLTANILSSPKKCYHKMAVEKKMFDFDSHYASTTDRQSSSVAQTQHQQTTALIACYDSGGQPEFFDVMPAFITSPTGYIMVFDMSKDLYSKENVQYYKDGKQCSSIHQVHYTGSELIKTALAYIQYNPAVYNPLSDRSAALTLPSSGKLLVAGTHLDKCGDTEEKQCSKVLEVENIMVEDIMKLPAEYLHISQRSTKNTKLLYPISNTVEQGRDEIAQEIRSAIEKMAAKDEEISNDIPISWMLLQLEIRLTEKYYISRDRCIDIAKTCYIEERDVNTVLKYFHELGMLLYYESVPSLKHVIFCDPQWLFDKLTKLIEVKYDPPFKQKVNIENGIILFDKNLLHYVYGNDFKSSGILQLESLLDLFEFLNIMAVLPGQHTGQEKQYFMPALLNPVLTSIDPSLEEVYGTKIYDTMLVKFEKTYIPRGVFCCLVTECMKRSVGWNIQYSKDVYRNLIIFQTSADHNQNIFLKDKIDSIAVEIYNHGSGSTLTTSADVICSTINKALHKVCKKMKINNNFKFGFACRCLHATSCKGFAVVTSQIPFQTVSVCEKCNHRRVLEDDQVGWLISMEFLKNKVNTCISKILM